MDGHMHPDGLAAVALEIAEAKYETRKAALQDTIVDLYDVEVACHPEGISASEVQQNLHKLVADMFRRAWADCIEEAVRTVAGE